MTFYNNDDESTYHEPIWIRGIHDSAGILNTAIETGHVVDNCELTVTDDYSENPQDSAYFIDRVCQLNGLQSLRFLPDRFHKIYNFPVHLLTTALQEATGLQMLSLCSVELVGTDEEFERFFYWLCNHQSVQLVRLIRCLIPDQPENLLDRMALNLCNMTSLREIELSSAEEWSLSAESLQQLYLSDTVEKLRLENFSLSQNHVLALFEELERNNSNLKGLFLSSCQMTIDGLKGTASMLASNNTLEQFSLCLTNCQAQPYDDACFEEIAEALHHNTTLRNLVFSSASQDWPKLALTSQHAFADMLRSHNFTLEAMSLFGRTDLSQDVDFYIALNRMGRKHLIRNGASKEQWFHAIVQAQVDINCLYFFLSTRPEILEPSDHD